jgi:hypothetical protein
MYDLIGYSPKIVTFAENNPTKIIKWQKVQFPNL